MKTICFVAAKSGGHILPCLTLASHLKETAYNASVLFISAKNQLDYQLTHNHPNIDRNIYITLCNIPYKKPYLLPKFFLQLIWATLKIFLFFIKKRPEKIISSGGYIATPVIIAGSLLRIPIELWELNVIPGKAIKWLSFFAQRINICFPETINHFSPKKCHLSSYPIRYHEGEKSSPLLCKEKLNLKKNLKTIFILGGSQGSKELNEMVKEILNKNVLLAKKIQVIHQTGPHNPELIEEWYKKHNIAAHVFTYKNNLACMYNAADIIISRAGAGALAEIIFFEKPAIIIPLTTIQTDHQIHNAQSIAKQFPQRIIVATPTESTKIIDFLERI